MNGGWGISCEIALRWMPLDLTDDKSTLVQVMAWCHQATSHYLSQCCPRSMSSNGITRPQWVNPHSGRWLHCYQYYSIVNRGQIKSQAVQLLHRKLLMKTISKLIHCPLRDAEVILQVYFSNSFNELIYLEHFLRNASYVIARELHWW